MKYFFALFLLSIFTTDVSFASSDLLYFEAQGVSGYSSKHKIIYRSGMPNDNMQLNSIGFDYFKKFTGEVEDEGTAALQMRIAHNEEQNKIEVQVYNAYIKSKNKFSDIWIGHNRVAYGLASYWDTHGDLLQPLSMYGFGFDRDWGIGLLEDTEHGSFSVSLTSGSGMGIRRYGNWLFASRISNGILNYDNYNIGLSFMGGKILEVVGYTIMNAKPKNVAMGSIDFSYNYDNIEHKIEINFGQKDRKEVFASLYRVGLNFLEENRLKLEGQSLYIKQNGMNDQALGVGTTYKIDSNLTARIMYEWQRRMNDHKTVIQIYYYLAV
ncbi:MAG: hypothetical protein LBS34_03035 [Rickettsiales bacterium]|jgi:hypothetical protein|nr:hypothetical protein [Rickettsiales bacterium]